MVRDDPRCSRWVGDTIGQFELAAASRLQDALALRARHRNHWALYTLGYVVEMHLKIAYFRLYGLKEGEGAEIALRMARAWARQLGIPGATRSLHDLDFWLRLIVAEREFARRPLQPAWVHIMAAHVQQVATCWLPEMRYRSGAIEMEQFQRFAGSVAWIVQNSRTAQRSGVDPCLYTSTVFNLDMIAKIW